MQFNKTKQKGEEKRSEGKDKRRENISGFIFREQFRSTIYA